MELMAWGQGPITSLCRARTPGLPEARMALKFIGVARRASSYQPEMWSTRTRTRSIRFW